MKSKKKHPPNIYEIYVENNCRLGFYVHRDSWSDNKYAMVAGIDGVTDGELPEGNPPYFNRIQPPGHPKEGKAWGRDVLLKAGWLDGGKAITTGGGVYGWTRV